MKSTCCLCGIDFTANTSYGLCPHCYSKDRLREYDRIESAIRQARRQGIAPVTLTLVEWLSVLSDFAGTCALCRHHGYTKILMVNVVKGLVYTNIVPACTACEYHYHHGFNSAIEEVQRYLGQAVLPKFIPANEDEYKDKVVHHAEYQ